MMLFAENIKSKKILDIFAFLCYNINIPKALTERSNIRAHAQRVQNAENCTTELV